MRTRLRCLHILALVGLGSLPTQGLARAAGATERRYDRGVELYGKGRYEEAIREFQAAYEIQQLPRLLYNIGQAHRKIGRDREAADHFERYLQQERVVEPTLRAELEAFITAQRAKEAAEREEALRRGQPLDEPEPLLAEEEIEDGALKVDKLLASYRRRDVVAAYGLLGRLNAVHGSRPDPALLFQIGRAYEGLRRRDDARPRYRSVALDPRGSYPLRYLAEERYYALGPPPVGLQLFAAGLVIGTVGLGGLGAGTALQVTAAQREEAAAAAMMPAEAAALLREAEARRQGAVASYAVGGGLMAVGAVLFAVGLRRGLRHPSLVTYPPVAAPAPPLRLSSSTTGPALGLTLGGAF